MRKSLLTLTLFAFVAALALAGCSQQTATGDTQSSGLATPKTYAAEVATEYRDLSSKGYAFLDDGETDSAVATFKQQVELAPEGKWGYYNIACAYGRNGQVDQGIEWLTKAVDAGHDDPGQIEGDGDLASLHDDPRFEGIVAKARATMERTEATFANGLPTYDAPPQKFASEEELDAWQKEQQDLLRANRSVWHTSQYVAARMDFAAKVLAAQKALHADDPEFDYGLERVRAMARIKSIWDKWGPFADGVVKEAQTYIAGDPTPAGKDEAYYWAGVASFCKHRPDDAMDPNWATTETAARKFFTQVGKESEFAGAARAWTLKCDLIAAGDNPKSVEPDIRDFANTYGDDERAMGIAGTLIQEEVIAAKWPIPIDGTDIDNKPVSLDQYKGKVLLVDFWATWCGPCRAELPHVMEAYKKYKDQGFDILSISLDYADRTTPEQYKEWIAEKGMNKWRHIYDQKDWDGPLVGAYMVRGIPNPVLIGRDGSLVAMGEALRGDNLEKTIQQALAEKGV